MPKSTPRLGKGLSAIIGPRVAGPFHHRGPASETSPETDAIQRADATAIRQLPLDQIRPNPRQPRGPLDDSSLEELADSIRSSGLLQPVLARPTDDGAYELVAGERRWRAAALAGLQTIPAIVRHLSDAESLEVALIENLQREDLGPLERARAYQQFIDTFDVSADQLATRLSQSRAGISNYLRLLKLDDEIQQMITSGGLGMGQARALVAISSPQRQLAVARLAVRRNLSVRQVEALAKRPEEAEPRLGRATRAADGHLAEVEDALGKALGLPVRLQPGKKKNSGRVIIRYNSLEEFDRIAEKLGGRPLLE